MHALQHMRRACNARARAFLTEGRYAVTTARETQDWLNQLQVVADEARELAAGNDQQASWLLVVAMCKSGLGLVQAWLEIITVAGLISELPVLERIAPPPSAWGNAGDRVAADPDSERARVLKRIRALLAKAEATDHAAEAETFTAKAQDLLTRHAIDEALLAAAGHGAVTVGARRVHLQNPYATTKSS